MCAGGELTIFVLSLCRLVKYKDQAGRSVLKECLKQVNDERQSV